MNCTNVPKLNKLKKDSLLKRDVFGRTILHIIILLSDIESLRVLTRNTDFQSILQLTDFENGWNCLHYIIYYKKIKCLKVLVEYLQRISIQNNLFHPSSPLMELLRCKDRCGNTPLHLLDNDFKDLLWIPEYIDEEIGFNLKYRYESLIQEDGVVDKDTHVNTEQRKPFLKSSKIEWNEKRGGSEVYVLGRNSNNQLGVGDSTDRVTPTMLSHSSFKQVQEDLDSISEVLQQPRYKQIVISKNHSLVVTKDGEVFSCGIGARGRLGHGIEDLNDYFKFQRILFFNDMFIKDAAISNNHSVVLTSHNQVYAWGLNSFNQLGVPNSAVSKKKKITHYLDNFLATPTLVSGELRNVGSNLLGVKVSKIHSVVWSRNALYFWGLNVGQMGIACTHGDIEVKLHDQALKGEIQASPKMVSLRDDIKCVTTTTILTYVVTSINEIHAFVNHKHLKLPKIPIKGYNDKHFDLFKPRRITEAAVIKKIVTSGPDHSMILLSNGSVLSFSLNMTDIKSTKYTSVWKAYDRDMVALDIDMSEDGSVVLCTRNGSVYIKSAVSKQRKNSMSATTLPIATTKNKFKKIENLNKVVKVSTFDFLSFGFIRDDIDILPLKVPKNDFFTDIENLSPIIDYVPDRKQLELLNFDCKLDTYMTNFIYPKSQHDVDVDDDDDEDGVVFQTHTTSKERVVDSLDENYHNKYDYTKNKPIPRNLTYKSELQAELTTMIENFNSFGEDSLTLTFLKDNVNVSDKGYNAFVEFEMIPDIRFGFHKQILASRSPVFQKLFDLNDVNEVLIADNFKAVWVPEKSTINVLTEIQLFSVLLVLHSVYTGIKLDIAHHYGSRHKLQERMKLVNDQYNSLCNLFDISHSKDSVVEAFGELLLKSEGDVVLKLNDGNLRAYSYILKSRSAFFETMFSERWDDIQQDKELDFTGLSKFQMTIILRHLYGISNENLLDYFIGKTTDRDVFIDEVLQLIEICDELLLFLLKCSLSVAICELISLENVVPLTIHSQYLSCDMIFKNCCWYMYNNLEVLIFDSGFTGMPLDILNKVETEFQYLSNCKLVDHKPYNDCFFESSSDLVAEFIHESNTYNEHFMSDRKGFSSFEPLIDNIYSEILKPKAVVKKRRSRKSSTIKNDIVDFRQGLIKERVEEALIQEVIDDHDGFTVVGKKSKQKSPPPNSEPILSNTKSETLTKSHTSVGHTGDVATAGLSPFSNWATKSAVLESEASTRSSTPTGNVTFEVQPTLSKPKVQKMKIGPVAKVSQKERKRLAAASAAAAAAENNTSTMNSKDSSKASPWSLQSSKVSPSINLKIKDLPVLGSSRSIPKHSPPEKKTISPISAPTSTSPTPSLADVMMQESFAKWWEEESKRVQKEMKTSGRNKKPPSRKKTNGNKMNARTV
ncbi:MAG: hypothetical protein M5E90_00735 [Asgard group archaeon]|nr:hypothetical protein [Asgard group archaeon]